MEFSLIELASVMPYRTRGPAAILLTAASLMLIGFLGCTGSDAPESESLTTEERIARNNAQKFLSRAQTALDENRYEQALRLIEKAEDADSLYAWVPYLRGQVYRALNQSDRAREAYERALDLDDAHPEVRLRLGELASSNRQYEEALAWYEEQWELLEEQLERNDWSYDQLPRGSRIATLMRTVPVRRARTLAELGRREEAMDLLQESVRRDSSHAAAHYYLAQIYQEEGQVSEALEYARRAAELRDDPRYRYLLGSLLVQENEAKAAIPHLRSVTREIPYHVGAHYNLGQALVRTGRKEEGRRYITRSDSLRSLEQKIAQARVTARSQEDNPARWLELAHLLRQSDRYQEAIAAYRTVVTIDSTIAEAWFHLGVTFGEAGRQEPARRALERTLEIDPDHPRARTLLEQLNTSS